MAHGQRGRVVARDQPAAGPPQRAGGQHPAHPAPPRAPGRRGVPRRARGPVAPRPCRPSGWRAAPLERRGLGHTVPMSVPRRVVPLPIPGGHESLRFYDVTSADGTRLRAWTNDADGPTVLLCNGLGTNPYAWPALLRSDCGVRVISWNHRGVRRFGPARRPGPGRRHRHGRGRRRGARRRRGRLVSRHRLVDRREHRLRARCRAPRPGQRAVRGRRGAGRHVRLDGRPAADPASRTAADQPRRRHHARAHRLGDQPGDLPAAGRATRRDPAAAQRLHDAGRRERASSSGRSASS